MKNLLIMPKIERTFTTQEKEGKLLVFPTKFEGQMIDTSNMPKAESLEELINCDDVFFMG